MIKAGATTRMTCAIRKARPERLVCLYIVVEFEPSSAKIFEKEDNWKLNIPPSEPSELNILYISRTIVPCPNSRSPLPVGTWGWPGDPIKLGKADVFIPAMYGDEMARRVK
jgi:hypothetical protein